MMNVDQAAAYQTVITACFFGTWVILGIGGFLVFFRGRDARRKRTWFPRYVLLVGVLFVVFSGLLMASEASSLEALGGLAFAIPMTIFVGYVNLKMTKFCDKCGAMIVCQAWPSSVKFCPKCGAGLDLKPESLDSLLE